MLTVFTNELGTVLKQWFGPDAGLPGRIFASPLDRERMDAAGGTRHHCTEACSDCRQTELTASGKKLT